MTNTRRFEHLKQDKSTNTHKKRLHSQRIIVWYVLWPSEVFITEFFENAVGGPVFVHVMRYRQVFWLELNNIFLKHAVFNRMRCNDTSFSKCYKFNSSVITRNVIRHCWTIFLVDYKNIPLFTDEISCVIGQIEPQL